MASGGEVKTKVTADTSGLDKGLREAKREVENFASDVASRLGPAASALEALGPVGLAVAATLGAVTAAAAAMGAAVQASISSAAALADNLSDVSARTGISMTSLYQLGEAAKLSGVGFESLQKAVVQMQQGIVGGEDTFKRLGLSLNELRAMDSQQQFITVAKAIGEIGDQAQRNAAALDAFGKSGVAVVAALGDIEKQMERARERTPFTEEQAAQAAKFADQTEELGSAWDSLVQSFGFAALESGGLQEALDSLIGLVVDLGKAVRDNKAGIVDAFEQIGKTVVWLVDRFRDLVGLARDWAPVVLNLANALSGGALGAAAGLMAANAPAKNPWLSPSDITGLWGGASKPKPGGGRTYQKGKPAGPTIFGPTDEELLPGDWGALIAEAMRGVSDSIARETAAMGKHVETDFTEIGRGVVAWLAPLDEAVISIRELSDVLYDWEDTLYSIARGIGGALGSFIGKIGGGIGNIGAGFDLFAKGAVGQTGIKSILSMAGGMGSMAMAAFDIGKTIFGGLKSLFGKPEWKKVGEEAGKILGQGVSKEMAEAIMADSKRLGVSIGKATLLQLPGAIGAQGASAKFLPQMTELLKWAASGGKGAGEALKAAAEGFSAFVDAAVSANRVGDKNVRAIIDAARAAGAMPSEISGYLKEKTSGAATGVVQYLGGMSDSDLESRGKNAGIIFAAAFGAVVKEQGLRAALEQLGPAFEKAAAYIPESMRGLFEKFGEGGPLAGVLDQIDGLDQALRGLADAGYMTTDVFSAMQGEAGATFQAMIDAGLSSQESLLAIAPLLQDIDSAAREYGITLDANTQALIDQAKAEGIAFSTDPIDRLTDAIWGLVDVLGGEVPKAAHAAGQAIANIKPPADPGDYNPHVPGNVPGAAAGGHALPRPGGTLVNVAEAGEGEWLIPDSKVPGFVAAMAGAGGGVTVAPTIQVQVAGGGLTGEQVISAVIAGFQRNYRGLATETQAALDKRR